MIKCERGQLSQLTMFLDAYTSSFFDVRDDVSGTLTLSHTEQARSITKGQSADACSASFLCCMQHNGSRERDYIAHPSSGTLILTHPSSLCMLA